MIFPQADRGRRGYRRVEVDEFFAQAREAYTRENSTVSLDADTVRTAAFTLAKRGYSIGHVDAALERLEDAFAARERQAQIAWQGDAAWYAETRNLAQVILDRVARPVGRRFTRVSVFSLGYSVREVDAFASRIADYFQNGQDLSLTQVRTVTFRTKRGGYREAQVDYLLDTLTRVMLAVQ